MGAFPAQLLLLALTGLCLAREELESVIRVQGSSLSTICFYNKHKYSQREKFWCKVMPNGECHSLFPNFPTSEMNYLAIAPKKRISVIDSGNGWISLSMIELRVEDSGTYFCGVSDQPRTLPLKKIKVAVYYEAPVTSTVKEGDSILLNCSCPATENRGRNFTWCKVVTATSCHPVVSVEFPQVINIQGRTMIQIDWRSRVVRVTLTKLQLRDSGKYHCESHLQGSTTLLKMITLNVLGELLREKDTVHFHCRTLCSVLAVVSLLALSALIATISLTNSLFSFLLFVDFQKDVNNPRHAMPDGGLKNGIIDDMLRFQPKPKPDNVTYANVEPSPKPDISKPSGVNIVVWGLFTLGPMGAAVS
uniref:Ig-like domain-containing protein n=1 Tax=Pelusios castaneus TaxID=367368 RepID=A0A8C8S3F8_9SAUR